MRLNRKSLEVRLEPEKVEELGDQDFATITVEFDVDDETYGAIKEALGQVFETFDVFKIV